MCEWLVAAESGAAVESKTEKGRQRETTETTERDRETETKSREEPREIGSQDVDAESSRDAPREADESMDQSEEVHRPRRVPTPYKPRQEEIDEHSLLAMLNIEVGAFIVLRAAGSVKDTRLSKSSLEHFRRLCRTMAS